ncbi:cellulase family glycosylhydrolase [Glycomyces harbinensis]|uniref:cellulase n=1 Tax=Glycomyces harbinensis TaxID=58114 RepID=A0A1G6QYN0_9ACTN|nr:cellulase family glycosylhydrolase [Glycomyces harbinensis]SDC96756.1 Aryl-phospho-beta-D-glucosidase BglC, GH1 family [Glycomyces harbinensis]
MNLPSLRRTRIRLLAVAAAVLALLATGLLGAVSAQAAQGCEVEYNVQSQWPGGFTADVKIVNLGEPVDGWDVEWVWPEGQSVTHGWNAHFTTTAEQVNATSLSYNAEVATGGSISFGFNGFWAGVNRDPFAFRLNGRVCDGTVGEPTTAPTTDPPAGSVTAMEQVAAMEPGWNVGNTLDALGGETAWGNPMITEELLATVKGQGFNSIRLPVTWDEFVGEGPDYAIDPARMERVAQVVDWALAQDLQVLLNLHHDSWMWLSELPNDHDAVLAKYEAIWTQIADRFKDHPAELALESINEPQLAGVEDAEGDVLVDELNRSFHDVVRGSGGGNEDRLLVLPTLHTSSEQVRLDALKATFDDLDDPMIAATVHFYGFWPFSVNIAGVTTFNAEVEADMVNTFQRVNDTFVDAGVPVIVGEWAVLSYDHTRPGIHQYGELTKFFEAAEFHARDKGVTTMLWDAGQFLNRNTLQWRDEHLYDYFASGWTTRSGTASFDSVYLPKSGAITSESLTLNRNGLDFEGLWQGGAELAEGADYTVSGDTLTLTAAALTRLAGDRAYGVNARIEARFSAGVPWRVNVITADAPVLSDATGPTASFAIPTQFRGDTLATMEAKYADGSNAGPANWTSYQEFWSNFRPDYDAGTLILTPEFLAAVTDGQPVTLTFHFHSGARVAYTITESGDTVTGDAG